MKRFAAFIILIVMVCSVFQGVYASEGLVLDKCGVDVNLVKLSGRSSVAGKSEIALKLSEKYSGTLIFIGQINTDINGKFDYSFAIGTSVSSGTYNLTLQAQDESVVSAEINYLSNADMIKILDVLKSAKSADEIYSCLSGYKQKNYLFTAETDTDIKNYAQIVYESGTDFSYDSSNADEKYQTFLKLCERAKNTLKELNSCSYTKLEKFFADNKDLLFKEVKEYNLYTSMTSEKKNRFAGNYLIKFTKTADSYSDFRSAFSSAYERFVKDEADKESKGNTPSGGGGGGGGAIGGGLSVKVPDNAADKPNESIASKEPFTDIAAFDWAKDSINNLYNKGIISPADNGLFRPGDSVTREEFIKMLVIAVGLSDDNAKCRFSDVSESDWYYRFVAAAYSAGLINGYEDNTFGAGRNITREEISAIAYRALKAKKEFKISDDIELFADDDNISPYASEAVYAMRGAGILNGTGGNMFMPQSNATRAEAAKITDSVLWTIDSIDTEGN